jgi:ABC-type sugar transport system ATPase subunit
MVLRSGRCVAERQIRDATMDEVVKYIVGAEAGEPTEDLGEAGATSKQFP